ncbi:hypothetical protein [Spirosoma flavum]|uniref:Uncharacterized protein n=1 Tax=Spirosoma flavum TaxID=2048557 RepID=A0ABW6AR53_9BACT
MEKLIDLLIAKPEIVVSVLSGFLLPIILVWLNSHYSLQTKIREKELDNKNSDDEKIKIQEKSVYASLSKILFDVQQLHVSLSGSCIDKSCIEDSVSKFDQSVIKYHEEISNNMLYMPSKIIDDIYRFYGKLSDLKISLKGFNDTQNYEMAHVSVYVHSGQLAEILIDIQDRLLQKRSNLKIEFDRTQQEMMKYCCGSKPPKQVFDKYMTLLRQIKPETTPQEIEMIESRWKA